jgi:hypothetical protein
MNICNKLKALHPQKLDLQANPKDPQNIFSLLINSQITSLRQAG